MCQLRFGHRLSDEKRELAGPDIHKSEYLSREAAFASPEKERRGKENMSIWSKTPGAIASLAAHGKRMGANESCHYGSGKKHKKC